MKNEFINYLETDKLLDSMCYDSGTQVCFCGNDDDFVQVTVRGYVNVIYKNESYRHFSEMPEELQEIMLKGQWKKFEQIAYIEENNWHEIEYFRKGEYMWGDVFEIGTPMNMKQLEEECKSALEWYKKQAKEAEKK